MRSLLLVTAVLAACGKPGESSKPGDTGATTPTAASPKAPPDARASEPRASEPVSASSAEDVQCASQPFAASAPLAEASGATVLADGSLLVVGDSGTHGAFVRLSADTGKVLQEGKLPLDKRASDDLEGLARMDGRLFGITSSGWMREWRMDGESFSLVRKSYALAKYDKDELVCKSARDTNCAQNYEGLCLRAKPPAAGQCAGFAAAKATGNLLCLTLGADGRLALDASRSIHVAAPKTLSGCHFDETDRLWFGSNFFAANMIGIVEEWHEPKDAVITRLGSVGIGFPEAIAVGPAGQVFRFSDTARSPSLLSKYICR